MCCQFKGTILNYHTIYIKRPYTDILVYSENLVEIKVEMNSHIHKYFRWKGGKKEGERSLFLS